MAFGEQREYFLDPLDVHICKKKSKSFFLSDVKLCNLFLASHYFITFIMKLLLELIWSSIMGTLDVQQPFMKFTLKIFCLLSCQFCYTCENYKYCVDQQRKKILHKYFYLIVKVLEENPKTMFQGGKRKRLSRPTKDVQGGAERLKLDGFGQRRSGV